MYGPQLNNFTLIAGVDTPQYRLVQVSGENYGGLATARTQVMMGISQNSADTGNYVTVCPIGESRCYVNSAVSAYDVLTATASGGVTVGTSGDQIIGRAMEAGAIGDIIRVFVNCPSTLKAG